ncbi:hypothetical protein AUJ14_00645 [Candidatus Micrarchaeota archaeon CG1_02_55_22]|nr:MAG: hypothetical protein AUJ14_00645 [Candidatus Micrarchaeota archaeon CG1_02_55_22]
MRQYDCKIAAVYLIFRRDGKLLLLKRINTGYEDGNYSLVAGHVDARETAAQAAVREAAEEAGVKVRLAELRLVHVMHRLSGEQERIDFFFEVLKWSGEPVNKEPSKCGGLGWFDEARLPDNVVPCVRKALLDARAGVIYGEYGWD